MKGGSWWLQHTGAVALCFTCARTVIAQAPAEASATHHDAAADTADCFPACRAGFVCHEARCVSMCNPPCPAGEACVNGDHCEANPSGGGVYEPPPPPPKRPSEFAQRVHSALGFHLGLGGDIEAESDGQTAREELDTTYGVNLRVDVPVVRYLLLGPLFQFGMYRPDTSPAPSRDYYADVDLYVRGRLPIELDTIALQVWAGVPVGLTLGFLGSSSAGKSGEPNELSGFGIGWNIGLLFGGAIHFSRSFGMFAEGGWSQHRTSHDYVNRGGDVSLKLAQPNLNLGFVFHNK